MVSLAIALPVAYFTSAKVLSTAFFIWAAIFLNASVATWEDALPGGFDNPDGPMPDELKGKCGAKLWLASLGGTVTIAAIGVGLFTQGL